MYAYWNADLFEAYAKTTLWNDSSLPVCLCKSIHYTAPTRLGLCDTGIEMVNTVFIFSVYYCALCTPKEQSWNYIKSNISIIIIS